MDDSFKLDKSSIKKYKLGEEPNDLDYWLAQPPEKRLEAVEYLRELYSGKDAINAGLQRVYRIIKRPQG